MWDISDIIYLYYYSYCLYLISCHVGSCGYWYDEGCSQWHAEHKVKKVMKIHLVSGCIMMNHNYIILYIYIIYIIYIYIIYKIHYISLYILHNNLHVALPRFAEVLSNLRNAIQWVSKWKNIYPGSELLRNLTNVKPVISPRISLFRRLLRGNDWLRRLLIRSDETLLGGWENSMGKAQEMNGNEWKWDLYIYIYIHMMSSINDRFSIASIKHY